MKKSSGYLIFAGIILFSVIMLVRAHTGNSRRELVRVSASFRAYVEAFTSGTISTRGHIKVRLNDVYADSVVLNEALQGTYFKFDPEIKGKTFWCDNRTLEFVPDEKLPPDQVYQAEFYLSKLVATPDSMKTMVFGFRTMPQEIAVEVENHKAYSHADLSREFLTGTVLTADVTDDQDIEKVLTATQGGRDLPVVWTHDPKTRKHHFQVDSIFRGREPGTVLLALHGEPVKARSRGDSTLVIPALGDFIAIAARSLPNVQQCIQVQFSDPLQPDQNLDGLCKVDRYDNLRYSVEDNLLKIYLPETENDQVNLTLDPSIRNINQKSLGRLLTNRIKLEKTKPNVRFIGDGVILPSSNGMLLPFEAVNVNAVDIKVIRIFSQNILQFLQVNDLNENSQLARVGRVVVKKTMPLTGVADFGKWNRFSIDLSTLLKAEPGAIYTVQLRIKKGYSTYPCEESDSLKNKPVDMVFDKDPESENDQNWDYYSSYQESYYGTEDWDGYNYYDRDNPCKATYYYDKVVSRNVLASDLGIIAKAGNDGSYHIFVTDLISSKPLQGVGIEMLNFQLQSLSRSATDGDGMTTVSLKKKPFLVVARYGSQTGYLKLTDGSSLSLSMFDVSGEPVQKGLKGFIYGERGVWRPGDSIFLTFVLEDKNHQLPKNHPVGLSLYNPSGQQITRMVRTGGVNGFYNFRTATPPDAPTGNWLAKVQVGGAEYQKNLKIETVKPNRLKIRFDFNTDRLIRDKIPSAMLEANWLTGATARNLKAKVMLTLSKSVTAFKNYPAYVFDNPTAGFAAENITIFDGRLDANGRTLVTPKIHVTNVAPGVLKASFETMVFEDGGDFSVDRFAIPYYPYATYAGLSVPGASGNDRVLNTDQTYDIPLLNVDANGALANGNRLKVEVYKLEWRWWWDDSNSGAADFISTSYIRPSDSATLKTENGKAVYAFMAPYSEWGRYLIKVTDRSSGHAAAKVVYVDWPGYSRMPKGDKQAAAMLTLTTEKPTYKVGEKVKLTLPSSAEGRALVTVETGTSVLKSFWVPTNKGKTDISFEATEAMSPNCYAYVTLIQPHAQTKNDLPIRLYGVIPIGVENPGTHLKPVITMADALEPGKQVSISVREANGKAMTYTLAMVDEGLLDLTRFKTPDLWSVFYAREALGVKTWDIYDQVMGAFSGELQRILSIGGDQEALNRNGLKANRFKPMVKFLGPFALPKGTSKTHTFTMPEYIGSVRVMVIAGQDGAYGQEEKTVPVKKPLMVLGTLPRVVGPEESVKLPVTAFAMEKSVKNVTVEVIVDDFFTLQGEKSRQITFTEPGDQLVTFDLKVAEAVGGGKVKIIATCGKLKAEHSIEIGVRNPNPRVTNVLEKTIQPGATWTTEFSAPGIEGTNKGTLEISSIPPLNLEARLSYLIHYPYGCIEQTVSAAFPQLFLANLMEMSDKTKKDAENNIQQAIRRIKLFQLSNGGISYWPESPYPDDWGTCYAGHFLLEAEQKGYSLPVNFLAAWKEFQRQKAVSWSYNASWYNNDLIQAYRLYTLALAKAPELGAMNRLLEFKNLSVAARWQLAAAYQLAGKREVAMQLINNQPVTISPYCEMGYTFGSDLRDKAMILDALTLLDLRTRAAELVKELSASLCKQDWYSTQTTSMTLMAISKFVGNTGGTGIKSSVRVNSDAPEDVEATKPLYSREIPVIPGKKGVIQVTAKGKNIQFARLILSGIPAYGDTTRSASNLKITLTFKSMTGEVMNPAKLAQGTNFIAEVTVFNPGTRGAYQNLALNQVFPSGWEVINARSSDLAQSKAGSGEFSYQDVRDDRVNTFFNLESRQTKTFRVMLMATYQGRFYLPPTSCEAMYDHSISARVPGGWVEVIPASK